MVLSILTGLARFVPLRTGYVLADGLSWAHRRLFAGRRRAVRANLETATGSTASDAALGAVFRNYGRTVFELLRGPDVPEIDVAWDGLEIFEEARSRGRGVVLATIHTGNWEIPGARLARRGVPLSAVAGVQLARRWTGELHRRQEQAGIRILPPGIRSWRSLPGRLADGETVALLVDGDLFRSGVAVPFLGSPVRLPAGPARLAGRTGAALVPAWCTRRPDGSLLVRFAPPITVPSASPGDVENATRALAEVLGPAIREHAEQWTLFRPFFGPARTGRIAA